MHLHIPTYTYTGCIAGGERQRVQRASARSYLGTLNIHWIYIAYTLNIHWIYIAYTLNIHGIYIEYTLDPRFPFIARTFMENGFWLQWEAVLGTFSSQGIGYGVKVSPERWKKVTRGKKGMKKNYPIFALTNSGVNKLNPLSSYSNQAYFE